MCVDVSSKGCHLLKILHSPIEHCTIDSLSQLPFYPFTPTENKQPRFGCLFRQVHEPLLFVLHNILYLSTVPQGADGCFLSYLDTFHLGLSYHHLLAVHESEREGKTFLSFINNSTLLIRGIDFLIKYIPLTLH